MSDLDPMAAEQFLAPEAPPVIAETDDYRVRLLTEQEFTTRASEFGHYPAGLPSPAASIVVIVEEKATNAICASWMLVTAPMLEGLWVRAADRGHQTVIHESLLLGMFSMLEAMGIRQPLTIAQDPAILALARKAGFEPLAGTLLKLKE